MKKTIIGVLVLSLALMGCVGGIREPAFYEECLEEKAMVTVVFNSWGENIEDSDEVIFGYFVDNYGYVEAKDVEVTCYIDNLDGELINSITEDIGNIASTSNTYKETRLAQKVNRNMVGYCYASACGNCELLNHRIREFKDLMK